LLPWWRSQSGGADYPASVRKEDEVLRRRLTVLLAAVIMLASMLAISGPASAQPGCKEFGNGVAENVQNGTLREEIPLLAPVNNDVHSFQGLFCG
jgi:hypothetical protein